MARTKVPTFKQCEKVVGEPASAWRGRCFEIASKIVASGIVRGAAVYGHFLGEISKASTFARMKPLGFCQHGWIKLADGRIADPTRWVFEAESPYLWVGPGSHADYDEGGNLMRAAMSGGPPPYDPKEKVFEVDSGVMDARTWRFVERSLKIDISRQEPGTLTVSQVHWLSNMAYERLGRLAPAVYEGIARIGQLAFVPLDNKLRAERESGRRIGHVEVVESPLHEE